MAVITVKEIYDILDAGTPTLGINVTDKSGDTQTLISSADAKHYISRKYSTRRYMVTSSRVLTSNELLNDFNEDFRVWVANRQHNIDKQYQALYDYDYSPIENVDRYETETIKEDGSQTYGHKLTNSGADSLQHGKKTVEGHSGYDSDVRNGITTYTTEKAGFNTPNSYTPSEKRTENRDDDETRHNYNSDITSTDSGTDTTNFGRIETESGTDLNDHKSERELRVRGNIGITTNNQLIEAEIKMRMVSLAEMLLDNFINDYTFYS